MAAPSAKQPRLPARLAAARLFAALVFATLLAGCAHENGASDAAAKATAEFNPRFRVDAEINGQPVNLILDTGSNNFALFQSAAERLRLKVSYPAPDARPPAGTLLYGFSEPVDLSFWGRTESARLPVLGFPSFMAADMDGVVGWPNIRGNIFDFDAADETYQHLDSLPAEALGWTRWNIISSYSVLVLDAPRPGGGRDVVFVDTGSVQGIGLSTARWNAWRADNPLAPVTLAAYFTPSAGIVAGQQAWAAAFPIGALSLNGVAVEESHPLGGGIFSAGEPDMTLGMAALRHLNIIVDGPNNVAYVRAKSAPAEQFPHNRLGAVFVPRSPRETDVLVARVVYGGPAFEAGIRNGDVLERIGPWRIENWHTVPGGSPMFGFWNGPAGATIPLTLSRRGREYRAVVTLRDLVGPRRP